MSTERVPRYHVRFGCSEARPEGPDYLAESFADATCLVCLALPPEHRLSDDELRERSRLWREAMAAQRALRGATS